MAAADRLNELLRSPDTGLDRILAAVAVVEPPERPEGETSGHSASQAETPADLEHRVVADLDRMAEECLSPNQPVDVFDHVYGSLGFTGNLTDYYDPANSLINQVLVRRRGIPLSLAAVVSEIARRHGQDLRPVGMPGHVLVGEGPEPSRWFDPFNRGVALGLEDCRALFGRLHPIESFDPRMLQPMTGLEVCVRTLNNLRIAYTRRGNAGQVASVLELQADLPSGRVADRLELAELLVVLGRFDSAAEQYQLLSTHDPDRGEEYLRRRQACLVHRN